MPDNDVYSKDDQAISWDPTAGALTVAQRWSGFDDNRHALLIFRFEVDRRALQLERSGTEGDIKRQYGKVRKAVRRRAVTEARAWEILADLGLPTDEHCTQAGCNARLPLGGRFCTECGTVHNLMGPGTRRPPQAS